MIDDAILWTLIIIGIIIAGILRGTSPNTHFTSIEFDEHILNDYYESSTP